MKFEDFVLHLDSNPRGGFRARVLKSPFGEGTVGFSLPSLAGEEPAIHGPGATRDIVLRAASAAGTRPPIEIGNDLFRSVFQGQVRTLLDKSLGQVERSPDMGLRLKIKLDPNDEVAGALADLPWELLCDGETDDFFALSRQLSVVRYLDVPRSSQPIPFAPPLRILAVGASPRNMEPLDLDEEAKRLDKLNQNCPGVEVKFLPHASAGAVREMLAKDTFNVLHFMGHGTFDHATGEGLLAFEGPDGLSDLVSGRAFATKLRDLRSLGVVVLNACETAKAKSQGGNPFRGVATALVLGGVPAVVAMQRPISDLAAIGFSTTFYRNLVEGDSIDEALTEGRQAIHSARPDEYEWATPVLFLRMPEGNVFVARPADRTQDILVPVPLPMPKAEAPPVVVPAAPSPPVSSRGSLVYKAVAGAAGAALVVFVVSTQMKNASDAGDPTNALNRTTGQMQTGLTAGPSPTPVTIPESEKPTNRSQKPVTRSRNADPVESPFSKPETPASQPSSAVALPPAAAEQTQPESSQIVAPLVADLTSLSAQLMSVKPREDGGLRVTVQFKNSASLPLSALLDVEGSALYDEQGKNYTILRSDLSLTNPRLEIPASNSSVHTFDFPAPKLGSKEFRLTLRTEDGTRVRISGSPQKLEGPL